MTAIIRYSLLFSSLLSFFGLGCQPQTLPARLETPYAPLNEKLATMVKANDQALSPQQARALPKPAIYLDARETAEYEVSHLPGALHLGYDQPAMQLLDTMDRSHPVVVYCTIGYRSEKMADKLRKLGFQEVYNLYGSIYAWALAGYPLENSQGQQTEKIHTYNKKWGSYYPVEAHKVY